MYTLIVKTPGGWKEPTAVKKSELTEHEAHMLAAEIYGEEYWAYFMGGEEKVKVVPKRAVPLLTGKLARFKLESAGTL